MIKKQDVCFEMSVGAGEYSFQSSIASAMEIAEQELQNLQETVDSVKKLKPECDKLDYALAASSGAICGVFDIFLVGKPGESPLSNINDKWVEKKVTKFAEMCGWKKDSSIPDDKVVSKAIAFLEDKFKIPYDQRGMGDAGSSIFDLNAKNHHFKSLGHNPSLLGLFFSILDQFSNTSHFVSETGFGGRELMALQDAHGDFKLKGKTVPGKILAAFVNWFGHLVSDVSGSRSSKGRGMGIPSPLWTWTNDVIAIKSQLGIPKSEFDEAINGMAMQIYLEGYDIRFQKVQAIPVIINELLVRTIYSIRRMFSYFSNTNKSERSFKKMMEACEPFKNPTVKRMLTVAHGTFCMVDLGDAVVRGVVSAPGSFDAKEFFLRLNIVGLGRFTISLYGEGNRAIKYHGAKKEAEFAKREKIIVNDYLDGLIQLSKLYDDAELLTFVDDLKKSDLYILAFQKTVDLAELRKVPKNQILRSKSDIDAFFRRGKK